MGIESIGGVQGAASYQSTATPAAKPVTAATEVAPAKESNNGTSQSTQSVALGQAVAIGNAANAEGQNGAGTDAQQQGQQQQREATMKDVNNLNKIINRNTVAEFGYNEPTNRITIKIKDKDTDEVIREIPSEKALEMIAKAWELAGMMVDEKR